jgi:MoaA/NifB/PqqE/SkfB family radical SAM enzyme
VAVAVGRLDFMWLELTGRCQLRCSHCYSSSGPAADHGTMTGDDWRRLLDQAAELDVSDVTFIGGEPTLHPDLPDLIRHALSQGLGVEVYSNLARVTEQLWQVFALPGMRLATSYYSRDADRHDAITGRRSHNRTLANIREALRRGIPIRVGVVDVNENQDVEAAVAELHALGLEDVRVDQLRQVGRGARHQAPGVDQLCGHCADGSLAVLPTGDVLPCPFARWLILGNVLDMPLAQIGTRAGEVRQELAGIFSRQGQAEKCPPKETGPPCPPNFKKDPPKCPPKNGKGP